MSSFTLPSRLTANQLVRMIRVSCIFHEFLIDPPGDRIPNAGYRCVLAYDYAADDPSMMLLFGCNDDESVWKRYNVSSDQ